MSGYELQGVSDGRNLPKHLTLGDIQVADICLAFFVITCVAFDDGSLVSQISRVVVVVGALFDVGSNRIIKWNSYYGWYLAVAVLVFLSRFWAYNAAAAAGIFTTVLYNAVCFSCAVFLMVRNKRRLKIALVCMTVAPVILEVRVLAYGGVFAFLTSRATGTISANSVGMFGSVGAFIAYGLYRENPQRKFYLFLFLFNLAIALLSASRKAFMVIGLVLLLLVVFDSNQYGLIGKIGKLAVVSIMILGGFFLVMNIPFLYELIGIRMEGMINGLFGTGGDVDSSTKTRMKLVGYGIGWFSERPILGYGGDNFRALMAAQHPYERAYYAHNNYIEMLVSYGVVGTAIYYSMPAYLLVKGFSNRKTLTYSGLVLLCLILGMLIMDYGMVEYYSRDSQMFIALAWVGLAGSTSIHSHQANTTNKKKVVI